MAERMTWEEISDQVCVPCAIAGKVSVGKVASLGNASIKALRFVFDGKFEEGSILTTDGKKSYDDVAAANGATAISASDHKERGAVLC